MKINTTKEKEKEKYKKNISSLSSKDLKELGFYELL